MRYEAIDPLGRLADAMIASEEPADSPEPPRETNETPTQRKREDIILAAGTFVTLAAMGVAAKGGMGNDMELLIEGLILAQLAYSAMGVAVLINNFRGTINRAERFWLN